MKRYITLFALCAICGAAFAQTTEQQANELYLEALRLRELNSNSEALQLLLKADSLSPQDPDIKIAIATQYIYTNQRQRASHYYKEATRLDPDNRWYAEALLEHYADLGNNDSCIIVTEELLKRSPNRTDLQEHLTYLYLPAKQADKSIAMLRNLEQNDGENEAAAIAIAGFFAEEKEYKKAEKFLNTSIKAYPNNLAYINVLAYTYIEKPDFKKAALTFNRVLKADPYNMQAQMGLLQCYMQEKNADAYLKEVYKVLNDSLTTDAIIGTAIQSLFAEDGEGGRLAPVDTTTARLITTTYYNERDIISYDLLRMYATYFEQEDKQPDLQRKVQEKILTINPSDSYARRSLLQLALSKQDTQWIIDLCAPVTEGKPEGYYDYNFVFYYYHAVALFLSNNESLALAIAERVILSDDLTGVDSQLLSELYGLAGDIRHKQGEDSIAYRYYEEAIGYYSMNVSVLNNYAYYISISPNGDLNKAAKMSRKTIDLQGTNSTYLDTYAWILFKQGKYADAALYMDKCIDFAKDGELSKEVLEHARDIYEASGLMEKAAEYRKKASEADETNE